MFGGGATTILEAPPRRPVHGARVVAVLVVRALVAVGLLAGATGSLMLAPADSDAVQFREDLDSGRVTWLAFGTHDGFTFAGPELRVEPGAVARQVLWRTGGLGTHIAPLDSLVPAYPDAAGAGAAAAVDDDGAETFLVDPMRAALVTAVEEHAARQDVTISSDRSGYAFRALRLSQWLLLGLFLVAVFGPQPRYATRWAWIWRLGLPLNIGALWLLARDAPWSRRAVALPAPLPHHVQRRLPEGDRRFTGGLAFLATMAATTLASWCLGSLLS
jgi:hypothetical protein